jgi:hypothetical protein
MLGAIWHPTGGSSHSRSAMEQPAMEQSENVSSTQAISFPTRWQPAGANPAPPPPQPTRSMAIGSKTSARRTDGMPLSEAITGPGEYRRKAASYDRPPLKNPTGDACNQDWSKPGVVTCQRLRLTGMSDRVATELPWSPRKSVTGPVTVFGKSALVCGIGNAGELRPMRHVLLGLLAVLAATASCSGAADKTPRRAPVNHRSASSAWQKLPGAVQYWADVARRVSRCCWLSGWYRSVAALPRAKRGLALPSASPSPQQRWAGLGSDNLVFSVSALLTLGVSFSLTLD